ncbi:MAG TPA: MDR family MFS transporter [Acidimicrobiales bacterium]|jgi:EmrB/QacA subfamily drug resistance transporter|nr:MDR family MFS transporter [Acidimicrobiales bacterium]
MEASSGVDQPAALQGRQLNIVFGGLMLVMLIASLDSTVVSTALPTIVGDLGGLNHISWVVTAYLLAQTVVTPLYGKLGDLYGRKIVLQTGIVLFVIGSALCGLSKNMPELIAFRAFQGLGGGGLIVSAQAAVGDVVSPRQRGKYQGLFGAVFGLAFVVGPLLGGTITTNLSWRWIFYINLPIGAISLLVLGAGLPKMKRGLDHTIDYLGTGVLAAGLSALVLFVSLGGTSFRWVSPEILGLATAAVVMLAVFVFVELRVKEPVLPMRLFKNSVFSTTSLVALLLGFAMFGSITYLPLYFQVVKGATPTGSGLQLLPMMAGLLIASIGSGRIISRTGKYRVYPIVGTAVMTIGLYLLSHLNESTSATTAAAFMFILGIGIGLVMQVLVIAVQNAVDYSELGVATSGNNLFRTVGSAIGTAIVGAVFANQLALKLRQSFPSGSTGGSAVASPSSLTPSALDKLPPSVHVPLLHAYSGAIDAAFLVAAGVSVVAFAASWLIKALPMRDTVGTAGIGEAFAVPKEASSLREIARSLSLLVGREQGRQLMEGIARQAGVDLSAGEAWMLFRFEEDPHWDFAASALRRGVPVERMRLAQQSLRDKGLLLPEEPTEPGVPVVTPEGAVMSSRLRDAGREQLETLLADWTPDQHLELAEMLGRLSADLADAPPTKATF